MSDNFAINSRGNSLKSRFDDSFAWGVATSAYQIEGAVGEGGRSPSVWDSLCQLEGAVLNGDTGAVACDHYHRYLDDIQLMAQLGVKHYRFSIAWSRIIPEGRGAVNEAGVDFYRRLVDALLENGITPHATLFHWDSPQALEDRYGSWRSREMAQDFADYAGAVVGRLGDRVTNWITLNEIFCFIHMGYGVGDVVKQQPRPPHAPGTVVERLKDVWQASHHALLAHGLGCQAIRAASPQPCQVSLVDNWMVPVPVIESPEHIEAAKRAFELVGTNGGVILPALTGRYGETFLAQLGEEAPEILPGDLETIHQPLDGLGFNVYTGCYVRAAQTEAGFEWVDLPKGYPRMNMPWLQVVPEAMYWGIRHVSETLGRGDLPIFVTENGCAAQDELRDGAVWDTDRIFYLRQYLRSAQRAVAEGFPLRGYFLWSLLDNFEWAYGYDRRFGVVYVDYDNGLERVPKASFDWFRECVRQGRVV